MASAMRSVENALGRCLRGAVGTSIHGASERTPTRRVDAGIYLAYARRMSNRTRPKAILLHLSDEERALLDSKSAAVGLSRADLLRLLLRGALPSQVPQ